MKILICGYIGGGNCGDEAICDRLINEIRQTGDEVQLLSLCPKESTLFHDTSALPRYSPAIIRAFSSCDLFILGGGTLLQTQSSQRSALYYLALCGLSAALGKPWILLGGLDPLTGPAHSLAKRILPTARAFFLRDRASLRRAQALAPNVPQFYVADTALLPFGGVFQNSPDAAKNATPHPYLLICPKSGVSKKAVASIVQSARSRNLRLVFLAMAREDEAVCAALAESFGGVWVSVLTHHAPLCRRARAQAVLPNLPPRSPHLYFAALPCEIACRLIGGAEEVYSARLHGLIFARKAGVRGSILPDGTKQWKFAALK